MRSTLTWRDQVALVASCTIVYVAGLWPSWRLRDYVLHAAGSPAYSGVWKFLPHLLLYSTLAAIVAAIAWRFHARAGVLEGPPLGKGQRTVTSVLGGAAAAIAITLGAFLVLGQSASIRWIPPDPWLIAGNLFSNFYEEFIFRGFLLFALARVVRYWPAAVVTSALWAAMHTQFPLPFLVVVFIIGLVLSWVMARSKTLWAPWGSHMLMDIVLDSLVG